MSGELAADERPATLFHYTTAAGLFGILSGLKLWATDLRFLNDAQESLYAEPLLSEAIQAMLNPVLDPCHHLYGLGEYAAQTFDDYRGMILNELSEHLFSVFVACFCEAGDLLSQWRGYGADHGYAIELRVDRLEAALGESHGFPPATTLAQVTYGRDAAVAMAERAVASLAETNLNHPGVKAHFKALEVGAMLASVKNPAFSEEREWRLITAFERFELAPPDGVAKFRPTPMAIVPYLDIPLSPEAIASVRVGPGSTSDVREAGVRALLRSIGSDATVLSSEVPLR